MLPFRTPFFLPWLYPTLTWRIRTTEKIIYLTFDDGPVPGPTEFVLETLATVNAKATFFCIGDNVSKHPNVFRKIQEQGHRIGNHTFNHVKGWSMSPADYLQNINRCETLLDQAALSMFRPPYGQIKRSQIDALKHYQIVMWDVLTQDYSKSLSPEACLRGSIRASRPGSIVVFHDSYKAERNLTYTLPRFLQHFHQLGFAFHSLDQV